MTTPEDFPVARLRRWPDIESGELTAADAADRLLLDTVGPQAAGEEPGAVVVIGDRYGALTLTLAAHYGVRGLRVHQDSVLGEQALDANAHRLSIATDRYRQMPLSPDLVRGARLVLLRLPKSLAALEEIAELVAVYGDPGVELHAVGRVKHMTPTMNEVLSRGFLDVSASLGRQKSRMLVARRPRPECEISYPRHTELPEFGLTLVTHGGVFSEGRLDIGTRFLLDNLPGLVPGDNSVDAGGRTSQALAAPATVVDLGCGSGVIATLLARSYPESCVIATDVSAAAVSSTLLTLRTNGLEAVERTDDAAAGSRVQVARANALDAVEDASVDLVVCNPPFHQGTTVSVGMARPLFEGAARALRPGGELWTVYNSMLGYGPMLARIVGPTEQVARNAKFTLARSICGTPHSTGRSPHQVPENVLRSVQ